MSIRVSFKQFCVLAVVIGLAAVVGLTVTHFSPNSESGVTAYGVPQAPSSSALQPSLDINSYRTIFSKALASQFGFKSLEAYRRDLLVQYLAELFDTWDNPTPDAYIELCIRRDMTYHPASSESDLRHKWQVYEGKYWQNIDLARSRFSLLPRNPESGSPNLLGRGLAPGTGMAICKLSFALPPDAEPMNAAIEDYFSLEFRARDTLGIDRSVVMPIIWSRDLEQWFVAGMAMVSSNNDRLTFPPI